MRLIAISIYSLSLLAESAAGIHWIAPAGWSNLGSRPMRAATYQVVDAGGKHEAAECAVYFFGEGQGGSVQANIDRWKGQFKPPNAQVAKMMINGLQVTKIDITGEYSGMSGPMAQSTTKQPGYRLLGAIVEGPHGNLFIKFTGPEALIAANKRKFDMFMGSFAKD